MLFAGQKAHASWQRAKRAAGYAGGFFHVEDIGPAIVGCGHAVADEARHSQGYYPFLNT